MLQKIKKNQFLFEELVRRDFIKKYKRTMLGMAWSALSPLLSLLVMSVVFGRFFGGSTPHYTIYLFSGNILWSYFKESTTGGMNSLVENARIFTKINIPKYMFLLSRNVSSFINFMINICIFFVFVALDGVPFSWRFLALAYPVVCFTLFNIGMGLVLSALYVFFMDTVYLYEVFTQLLMYLSAIFYTIDGFSQKLQMIFLLNPVYIYIRCFRYIVIDGILPPLLYSGLAFIYAAGMLLLGAWVYKRWNHQFLYYV